MFMRRKRKPPTKKEAEARAIQEREDRLAKWVPKTRLGKAVMEGKIKSIDDILDKGLRIREPEIVDFLVPNIRAELALIGGRPGKGGGIERTPIRMTAKMHRSGRRYRTSAFAIVGNDDGIVGIGKGTGTEGRLAIRKAIEKAKISVTKIRRGCGSWECECGETHSIPFKTTGKCGSVLVTLLPAPKGIGLAVDDESKKILKLAGITDVWGKTLGNTGARFNLIRAMFNALKNLHRYRVG